MIDKANGDPELEGDRLAGLKDELLDARHALGMCEYIDHYPDVERCREKCHRRIAHLEKLIAEIEAELP